MPNITHLENYKISGNRRCGICKSIKPISDFPRRKSGRYEGALLFCCNDCNLDRVHNWNKQHPGATAKRNHAKGKCLPYAESASCHIWIGIHVTEGLALHYFPEYQQAQWGNSGYDLIDSELRTIDCKASRFRVVSHDLMGWQFAIDRNKTPTHFFCVAFGKEPESRPVHAWMIPNSKLSHLKRLSIYPGKRSMKRWEQYKLPIAPIIECWKKII
jgi:hypothetical protein